jgi:anaerobic magnesium-protoporphyrin IX monomethyl ester cyclase
LINEGIPELTGKADFKPDIYISLKMLFGKPTLPGKRNFLSFCHLTNLSSDEEHVPDILLVKPQRSRSGIQTYPPIGMGFISSYLKKKGYSVRLIDCDLDGIAPDVFTQRVDISGYRIIGFQVFTMDMPKVKEYLSVIKQQNERVITIVGGPQIASDPIASISYLENGDYAVFGEGEISLARFLEAMNAGKLDDPSTMKTIPNLLWKHKGEYQLNALEYADNLDEIGAPDWEEIEPMRYRAAVHGFFSKKLPTCPVIVTRGCPYRCKFCGGRKITGYRVRSRDPLNVIDEIKVLRDKYHVRQFQIIDDNFTGNRRNAMRFCQALIEEKMEMPWNCPNGIRLDTLDDELLDLMRKSGCYEVAVGIESGNQDVLDHMGKRVSLEQIREKVRLIDKHDINVVGFIIIGYPTETAQTVEQSRKLAIELPLLRVSLTRFAPFPGTPIADDLIRDGKLRKEDLDFRKLSYMSFSYIPEGFDERTLRRLFLKFFLTFYLRPGILLKNMRGIHSFRHLLMVVRKVINFVLER